MNILSRNFIRDPWVTVAIILLKENDAIREIR